MADDKLMLYPRRWYAWQSIVSDEPETWRGDTPIFVSVVAPRKLGEGYLDLDLIKAVGGLKAVRCCISAKVRHHSSRALIATTHGLRCGEELFAITPISLDWFRLRHPSAMCRFDNQMTQLQFGEEPDPQAYLSHFLGETPELILSAGASDYDNPSARPMPMESGVVPFQRCYSGIDAWLFLRATKPIDMDHRWYIYVVPDPDGGLLRLCRSWTGYPQWEVRFEIRDCSVITHSARMNLDRRQRVFGTPDEEVERLDHCIAHELLGQPHDWSDIDCSDEAIERAAAVWAGLGYAAAVGKGTMSAPVRSTSR